MDRAELKMKMVRRSIRPVLRSTFGVFVVAGVLSAGVVSKGRTSPTPKANPTVNMENARLPNTEQGNLDFTISVENPQWTKEGPIKVKLRVHNSAGVAVQGQCAFTLVRQPKKTEWYDFWGSLRLQKAEVQSTDGPSRSSLEAGQQFDLELDLKKLKWGRVNQALWPVGSFSEFIEPGDYELYFYMEVREKNTPKRVKSNRVKISIQ